VEGADVEGLGARPERGRLAAGIVAGVLVGGLAEAALLFGLDQIDRWSGRAGPDGATAAPVRSFLNAGGWLAVPLWGGALGAALAGWGNRRLRGRVIALGLALVIASVLVPAVRAPVTLAPNPRTLAAKLRVIRRDSYRAPLDVLHVVTLSRDPDPRIRELATLALGRNRVVDDLTHAARTRPIPASSPPVRDALRERLEQLLAADPEPAVRAEAARALWNAPQAFGRHGAAAETLGAVLDRAARGATTERMAWLALDAAAGPPDAGLRAAASRFAAATSDSDLARAARVALRGQR